MKYNEINIFDGLSQEETEELSSYLYNEDLHIDNAIERIKEVDAEIERISELSKQKIEQIKLDTEKIITKLNKKKQWDVMNLGAVIDNDPSAKETKTQKKKTYLSGEVIRKKEHYKMVKPDWDELDVYNYAGEEFLRVKTIRELDWAEFKKKLKIVDGVVWNEDGEKVLVDVEFVPAETIIK